MMRTSGHSPFSDAGAKSMKLRHISPAEQKHVIMISPSEAADISLANTYVSKARQVLD